MNACQTVWSAWWWPASLEWMRTSDSHQTSISPSTNPESLSRTVPVCFSSFFKITGWDRYTSDPTDQSFRQWFIYHWTTSVFLHYPFLFLSGVFHVRQGKFVCVAQFRHKASQNALQEHTDYIKRHSKLHLKDIKIALKRHWNLHLK